MNPLPVVGRSGGLTLGRKLPLLITSLLVATMTACVVFAYSEVRDSAVETARERLRLASRQLADLVQPGIPLRVAGVAKQASVPEVAAYLSAPSATARPGVEAILRGIQAAPQPGQPGDLPVLLLDRRRRELLRVGTTPVASELPRALAALPDHEGVSRLFPMGPRAYFWVLAPVRKGSDVIGFVAELRTVGGASDARNIQALIGTDVAVSFANSADRRWVALDGTLRPAPAAWPFAGSARFTSPRGEVLAHQATIERTPWSVVVDVPVSAVLARPRAFLRRSLYAALLLGLVGALGAWGISRGITVPLRRLRRAAEAIARGEYGERIHVARTDELGVLAGSFNWMASHVQASHNELRQQYEAAHELGRELERANRAKSEFMATMSHEIRTPINAIIGYADLLQMGISGPVTESQRAQLERIRLSGEHLTGLVNQVLDLSRIEAGALEVERGASPLREATEKAAAVLLPQAEAKGVELVRACGAAETLHYLGDPQRVIQILVNLLSNGVKFTEAGGRVTLRCAVTEERRPHDGAPGPWICVSVEDTGVGIEPEQHERIFEPFVQVESGYTRRHGGAGLGLAISRQLARSMGGDLTVDSVAGRGSTFTLWLALAPARAEVDGARADLPPRTPPP